MSADLTSTKREVTKRPRRRWTGSLYQPEPLGAVGKELKSGLRAVLQLIIGDGGNRAADSFYIGDPIRTPISYGPTCYIGGRAKAKDYFIWMLSGRNG